MALHRGYKGANTCTRGAQPGARGFMSWFLAKYKSIGGQNSGIYNCRKVRGSNKTTSLHGEGRAVDLGLKYTRKEFWTLAELLRKYSKELGIQCIIYDRKIWSGGYSNTGWQKYIGVNPHTDHLHVEMAWWSAQMDADKYVALLERTIGKQTSGKGAVIPQGTVNKPKPKKVAKQSKTNRPNGSTAFPTDFQDLDVDKKAGELTYGAHQIVLHATAPKLNRGWNKQWDGKLATRTVRDTMDLLQANGYYKVTPFAARGVAKGTPLKKDGKAGFWFWVEFQRFLADARGTRGKKFYTRAIDGDPKGYTVAGWQSWLNTQNGG